MKHTFSRGAMVAVAVLATLLTQTATAQPGGGQGGRGGGFGGRGFRGGTTEQVALATLEQVQEELKLDDDAKQKVADLNQQANEERRNIFQGAQGGDPQAMREDMAKLNADIAKKLTAALSEEQQQRLQQLYLQVNGALALADKAIAEALKMTEEQQADFTAALAETRQRRGGGFGGGGGGQNLTPEERAKQRADRNAARNKALLAVLSEDQQKQFVEMKGEKLEIDTTALFGRGRFGGGRGGQGGGRGLGGGRGSQQ